MSAATTNRRKQVNPVNIAPLARWMILAIFIGSCGLMFVYVKNQQYAIGEETRRIEKQIAEARSQNEVLVARISALSSRSELQRKLTAGMISLQPIQDIAIARLTPPTIAERNGVPRTAANEGYRP